MDGFCDNDMRCKHRGFVEYIDIEISLNLDVYVCSDIRFINNNFLLLDIIYTFTKNFRGALR
jgi:hypothetical protein